MELILGVDGGNTKTIAVVARTDGTILGWGRSGCSDIYGAASPDAALGELEAAVQIALDGAGAQRHDLLGAGFSLAGADWPEDIAFLQEAVRERGLGRARVVVNDGMGPLRANSPDGTGVAVACGTGLAVGAHGHEARTWHGGFWLESHGAREMGVSALRAAARAELGIECKTSLTERIPAYYDEYSIEDVLHRLTARSRVPGPPVAGIAVLLLDEAAAGDDVSRRLVRSHGAAVGDYVLAAAREVLLYGHDFHLVLSGGIFRHPSKLFEKAIVSRVRKHSPGVRPMRSRFEPVVGALLLGFDAAGVSTDGNLMSCVAATIPPRELFATHTYET